MLLSDCLTVICTVTQEDVVAIEVLVGFIYIEVQTLSRRQRLVMKDY